MRPLPLILAALLVAIQFPLWVGERGWLEVGRLSRQLESLQAENGRRIALNSELEAELRDLADGRQAVEERARYELGMVGPGEIFVQINDVGADKRGAGVQTAGIDPLGGR